MPDESPGTLDGIYAGGLDPINTVQSRTVAQTIINYLVSFNFVLQSA
jgi:hypothetical protein